MTTDPALLQFLSNQAAINQEVLQMTARQHWQETLATARYQQPKRLLKHGHKVYSQQDEDGIIAEILRRLGDKVPRSFIEFGVENGLECNTLRLLLDGWSGLWLEGEAKYVEQINTHLADYTSAGKLKVGHAFVTTKNVNELFTAHGMTGDIGLLSIDIDGNDIWVWQAVTAVRPAIFISEYNATWAPPLSIAQPSDEKIYWRGTNYFGCSLAALAKVSASKGYKLVGCNFSGANAFFVREDLVGDHFHAPFTAEEHYEPARYWLRFLKAGHRAGVGPVVTV
jgi:hypothetical protein